MIYGLRMLVFYFSYNAWCPLFYATVGLLVLSSIVDANFLVELRYLHGTFQYIYTPQTHMISRGVYEVGPYKKNGIKLLPYLVVAN